jgi:hypothetical protein
LGRASKEKLKKKNRERRIAKIKCSKSKKKPKINGKA